MRVRDIVRYFLIIGEGLGPVYSMICMHYVASVLYFGDL